MSENMLNLVKFVCSSNLALKQLQSPELRKLLMPILDTPSYYTIRHSLIPNVYDKLISIINSKLQKAISITLIPDIWTNNRFRDFLGIAACLSFGDYKETITIGFSRMKQRDLTGKHHSAENLIFSIDHILKEFSFDSNKIIGISSK